MSIGRALVSVLLAIFAFVPTKPLSAQTLEESLAWLNANQHAQTEGRRFYFNADAIGAVYGMRGETIVRTRWSSITSIQRHPRFPNIIVISGERSWDDRVENSSEDVTIRAGADGATVDRWIRALTHVAQLRGASLVKADLFDPPAY